ncbi:penicillin acylase family protein [Puia sp.]|uniref:penicillin acylase family protein n=1 Tax=Puia sp. TaxID=2045100 RepID=UPI002F40621D
MNKLSMRAGCRHWLLHTLFSGLFLTGTVSVSAQEFTAADRQRCEQEASQVTVVRDQWGVPHIYGKTDASVVFGLLYAECQEDIKRVEKNYLEVLGRQAEAYGENYLYTDLMMRLIYDSVQAKADYEHSPVWMHRLLDAFADGINYYLYKHPGSQPLVLKHFEPWYALMFTDGSVSATSTGGVRVDEIKNFYSQAPAVAKTKPHRVQAVSDIEKMVLEDRGIGVPSRNGKGKPESEPEVADADGGPEGWLPDEDERGSNGFALAGFRTASEATELYINPHVPFYFRMECQLVSEEGLNTYGAVTWGQFFIYQGFNAHCGWMHTSSYADVADLYMEKVKQENNDWVYEYEGQTKPVKTKEFTIYYNKDGVMQTLPVKGLYTHHGPVIASREGKWLSLREYNRSLNALEEAWLITKANTFEEYKKAMDLRANTTNNTVYADDQGNIAYWHGNFMPRRDSSYDWSHPVDGSIAATEWKGLHELDEIVHVYNPATGWIQNCNSTPYSLSGNSSPERRKYPAYMAPDGENFRAVNAVQLISGANNFTLDSLMTKGYDHYLTAFDVLLPALFDAYSSAPDSTRKMLQEPISVLQKWDRRSGVRSVATTLAVDWGMRMAQYAPRPKTPEEASNAVGNVQKELERSTPQQKTAELAAVVNDLRQRYGSWKIQWGEVCRYQRLTGKIVETYDDRKPSLPVGLVSSAFGELPSFVSRVMPNTKKRYGVSGNSFIAAVEFGKKVTAKTIVTGGESSDPASPHFSDQASMYLNGQFKDVLFYPEDVNQHVEKKYHPGEE